MADLTAWLLSIGSLGGIVLLTVVAARSFAGDAARGRRRCPRCWHEIGPTGFLCAECGSRAPNEQALLRARRAPVRGMLAIAGIVAIALAGRTRFLDRGPWSIAPTSVLVHAVDWFDDGGYRSAPWELAQRIAAGDLDDAQLGHALALFVEGDSDAPPPSDAWKSKYGQIGRALLQRIGRTDARLTRLVEIPPRAELEVIPGNGTAPLAIVDAEVWWPGFIDARARLAFADGNTCDALFEPTGRAPGLLLPLDPALLGTKCTLTIEHRSVDPDKRDEDAWTTCAPIELEIPKRAAARPPSGSLVAVDGEELRTALAAAFAEGLVLWKSGVPRAGLRFNTSVTADERFDGVAIGLVVELLENGVVRRTSRIWWRGGLAGASPRWIPSEEDRDALARLWSAAPEGDARWSIRVRGDAGLAEYAQLPAGDVREAIPSGVLTKYFAGTFEAPLAIERMNAPSPVRRWRLVVRETGETGETGETPQPIAP
ncbi:MAG: hypothetical protein ACKO3W_16065 [bacterium]